MLELETDAILKSIVGRTIGESDSVSLKDVVSADIPKGIKVYIQAEVEQGLKAELMASEKFARVGGKSTTATHLMRTFLGTLALEYAFPRDEFLSVLDNAVHFLENYLCRPHWTLEHFLFEDTERISCDTLLEKLQHFTEYAYLITLLERLIRQKGWEDIAIGDFRSLLVVIDDQIVKQHSARELATLARPIFEFLLRGDVSPHNRISLKPLLVFYEDKNMRILKLYLERICQIRGKTELSITELAGIIEDLYADGFGKPEQREPVKKRAEASSLFQPDAGHTPELPFADSPQGQPPVPSLQKPMTFKPAAPGATSTPEAPEPPADARDVSSSMAKPEPAAPVLSATPGQAPAHLDSPDALEDDLPEPIAETPDNGKKNIPLSLTFAGLKNDRAVPHPRDLNAIISKEQREKFIKKLFRKNEASYADTIAELNSARTWRDASLLLNQLFETNKLNPFSDDVIEFTDTVQQRYTIEPTNPS